MRIALVSFCPPSDRTLQDILKNLVSGPVAAGKTVDVINGNEDMTTSRLTMYDYIALVVPQSGFFSSRLPPRVSAFLSSSGTVTGKKGCALVVYKGLFKDKLCRLVMKVMEKEGILLDYYDCIRSPASALAAGKKIG